MKIYGPYLRKDGRKHICIVYEDGTRKTKSYPKFLLEQKLQRELVGNETTDHIDNDFTNDSLDNLTVLSNVDNAKKYTALHPRKLYYFICGVCGNGSKKYLNFVISNWKKKKEGPFCSRRCAGIFSHYPK